MHRQQSNIKTDLDNLSDSEKLNCILAQITTINTRLDSHGQRLALLEKTVTNHSAILAVVVSGADHSGGGQVLPADDGGATSMGGSRATGVGGNTPGTFN
jgi:hypothetical protein